MYKNIQKNSNDCLYEYCNEESQKENDRYKDEAEEVKTTLCPLCDLSLSSIKQDKEVQER